MDTDYLYVIGIILLFNAKTFFIGLLCICMAYIFKKIKWKKGKKDIL